MRAVDTRHDEEDASGSFWQDNFIVLCPLALLVLLCVMAAVIAVGD
jgi:hypothetical protein